MNLSSKDNSLKLPTNCDPWENNFVLFWVKALQEIEKCISSSTLSLSHTLCLTGNLSYLPVSILKDAVPHLNMEKHLRNLKAIGLLRYISVSKVFLNVLYVLNLLLPFVRKPISNSLNIFIVKKHQFLHLPTHIQAENVANS